MKKYCDEVYTDAMGNLIARKKGSGKKVMLAAHMDEIGIMVTNIDENGFLSFTSIGGLNTPNLSNLRVEFKNGIKGVIGAREEEFRKKASLDKLYIDIGVSSKKEAEKLIVSVMWLLLRVVFIKRETLLYLRHLTIEQGAQY